MDNLQKSEYQQFLADIKAKVRQSQLRAMQAVNNELIGLYTDIGRMIVEKQENLGWGKSIVENIAKDLQTEFPGTEGFSSRNLWRMRTFYLEYKDSEKLPTLVAEISWSHNIVLIEKCKGLIEREFYIRMVKKYGWSKSVLIHQIESKAYERFLLNQTNFDKSLDEKLKNQAKLAVKDIYNFEFIELAESYYGGKIAQKTSKSSPRQGIVGSTYDRAHNMANKISLGGFQSEKQFKTVPDFKTKSTRLVHSHTTYSRTYGTH
ncbi:MAG: DUF1016 N-terminal domain-containing protein [Bacteroidales bacterium]|nr:DUF1016 N-terminal domain-containing protein [Bacteroidales bacterium]